MLDAYSTNQVVTANNDISLNTVKLQTGRTVTLNNNTVHLNTHGIYTVSIHATGSTTEGGTLGLQLYTNGQPIERAAATAGTVAGVKVNLAFNTLLTVANSDYSNAGFTIRNTGSAGTLDVIEAVVTKIR